jgi:hypothetical protein
VAALLLYSLDANPTSDAALLAWFDECAELDEAQHVLKGQLAR